MGASLEEIFWSKVNKTEGGCWNWKLKAMTRGYAGFHLPRALKLGKEQVYAHRFAYELVKGKIPEGLDLDHLCRNRVCVNPEHLEPVSRGENLRRGNTITRKNWLKTHCIRGHPFNEENTYFRKDKVARMCRACKRVRNKERREKELGQYGTLSPFLQ